MPDISDIALSHTVINEVSVEIGQVERGEGLDEQHQQNERYLAFIWGAILLEDLCEHDESVLLQP